MDIRAPCLRIEEDMVGYKIHRQAFKEKNRRGTDRLRNLPHSAQSRKVGLSPNCRSWRDDNSFQDLLVALHLKTCQIKHLGHSSGKNNSNFQVMVSSIQGILH
jgi:hypothetical protein